MTNKNVKQEVLDEIFSMPHQNLELLRKKTFLKPLIKTMIRDSLLNEIKLEDKLNIELSEEFFRSRNIIKKEDQEVFKNKNLMDEEDLAKLSSLKYKLNQISLSFFGDKTEELFNKRKEELDQYVYSLIQVKDSDLAQELYLKIESKESEFYELASEYSLGVEKYKKGVNGPVSLMRIHPEIKKILKSSEIGIINEPINLGEFWILIRLEEVIEAEFNEKMREQLSKELFEVFMERLTKEIIDEIKDRRYKEKFK